MSKIIKLSTGERVYELPPLVKKPKPWIAICMGCWLFALIAGFVATDLWDRWHPPHHVWLIECGMLIRLTPTGARC